MPACHRPSRGRTRGTPPGPEVATQYTVAALRRSSRCDQASRPFVDAGMPYSAGIRGRSAIGVRSVMDVAPHSGRGFVSVVHATTDIWTPPVMLFDDTAGCMRADRLLSILMLLQAHGRLPARALAERLEVSERTVHRDMESLSMAGVPVYAERGRHGGWSLAEAYRTDLTGLTETELRSVVVSTLPGVLADLGLGDAAERALLKLLAALPEARRRTAEAARGYLHIDPSGWRRTEEAAPLLP